ncbi:hypothetical protein SDC9_194225 [bioreactor metagenome]|uniref:Uncharacterized protein n=1 Tax=bioreactor metagenome TaxID=1076179 RepID=A0A645IEB5_9ZZZZ
MPGIHTMNKQVAFRYSLVNIVFYGYKTYPFIAPWKYCAFVGTDEYFFIRRIRAVQFR